MDSIIFFVAGMVYASMLYEINRRWTIETVKIKEKENKKVTVTGNSSGTVRAKKPIKKR